MKQLIDIINEQSFGFKIKQHLTKYNQIEKMTKDELQYIIDNYDYSIYVIPAIDKNKFNDDADIFKYVKNGGSYIIDYGSIEEIEKKYSCVSISSSISFFSPGATNIDAEEYKFVNTMIKITGYKKCDEIQWVILLCDNNLAKKDIDKYLAMDAYDIKDMFALYYDRI